MPDHIAGIRQIRQQQLAAGAQIGIAARFSDLVGHGEVVRHTQGAAGGRELQERIAVVLQVGEAIRIESRLERAICGEQIHIPGGVGRRAAAAHPDRGTCAAAVGRHIEHRGARERCLIVGDDPAGVGFDVAVRRPTGVDRAVRQQQRRPLGVLPRLERRRPAAGGGIRGGNFRRPVEQLCPGRDVQRVQPLVVLRRAVLGHGNHVDGTMGAGTAVDHGSGSDPDLGHHLVAAVRVTQTFPGAEHRHVPERRTSIGVEGVHRVMLGSHEHHVVCRACYCKAGEIQRLRVDLAVHRQRPQQSKCRGAHVSGRENGLGQILAGAPEVILVGHHIGWRRSHRAHGECGTVAGDAAERVTHHDYEFCPAVGGGRSRCRVVGRGRTRDRRSVPLPLVAQGRSAAGSDRERGSLSEGNALVGRLTGNRGRPRRSRHRSRRVAAAAAGGEHGGERPPEALSIHGFSCSLGE